MYSPFDFAKGDYLSEHLPDDRKEVEVLISSLQYSILKIRKIRF